MRVPSTHQLVAVWEKGGGLSPTERALELLCLLEPDVPRGDLAELPIGARDQRLLWLRQAWFGPLLDATSACEACGEHVEFALEIAHLLLPSRDSAWRGTVDVGAVAVEFRLPTSADLLGVAGSSPDAAEATLLERCVTRVMNPGPGGIEPTISFEALRRAVAPAMAAHDPQADIQLSLSCPECGHAWVSEFDVVAYLWAELTASVQRLLVDVHRLAWAYGWTETEILGMSSARRAAYLELVDA